MSLVDVGLALGLAAAAGTALGFGLQVLRLRARLLASDVLALRWHRRHGGVREELERLREEVAELGYVLHDAQRRWGFDLGRWPDVAELIGEGSPEAASRFLIEWAPGIGGLRAAGRATDRVA